VQEDAVYFGFMRGCGTHVAKGGEPMSCHETKSCGASEFTRAVEWGRLTWEECGALSRQGMETVLLPVGATEQHGPHLACDTDTYFAREIALRVSARTGVPVLPELAYGCSLGHSRRWPGTVALPPALLAEIVTQIYDWVRGAGFRRMLVLNAHVTNFAPLRCAIEVCRSRWDDALVTVVNLPDVSARVRQVFDADAVDWHANDAETSLMYALDQTRVRPDRVADADDPDRTEGLVFAHPVNRTSINGVTGYPSRATHEKGRDLLEAMVDDLEKRVRQAMAEHPPLPFSYNEVIR